MSELGRYTPRVRASWRRSEHYGISTDRIDPAFTGSVDTGSLFYECGLEVLTGLQATLANEPLSLMIADAEGLVLTRLCEDSGIRDSLDRVHLAPGFSYSERDAGTNGLGLALADRTATLVKGPDHYCSALYGYTCAAVPVLDPRTGELAGSVNLTTWSDSSSGLLLALAQAAAANTSALMLLRAGGHRAGAPAHRGEVFRVQPGTAVTSPVWRRALEEAHAALADGRVLAVVGESGSGRRTLAHQARQLTTRRERILAARPPAPDEVEAWLATWTPELSAGDTCVIVSDVQELTAWAAQELASRLSRDRRRPQAFVLTATDYASIPDPLAVLVDSVVEVPALHRRPDDVMPLADHFARAERHRDVEFTPAAAQALTGYDWPGNVRELERVVREAAARSDLVDVRHLSPSVLAARGRRLSRLETLERDEIIRCLAEPGMTLVRAAGQLGMGRATLYRKISQYGIKR
ncbi:AAA-type ATPase lid domain-containing protein [Kineosporia succinea]|uniref:Energy-coupling factor transporter ATP-binding protein EcfA2 n=1 Tax=Kineosporia succinea TaxID=84632 RepID=A0ABT9P8Z2_9ACTN|nr:helix-turn-helix domain-containing protein [Kineosporia succinea]MDP9829164.1 energy-coupling factor transporter ATP-binding protein EcfA2 [Kineosporia succinea]